MSAEFFHYLYKRETISRSVLGQLPRERLTIIREALRTCESNNLIKLIDSHEFYGNLSFLPWVWTNRHINDYFKKLIIRRVGGHFLDKKDISPVDYWTFVLLARPLIQSTDSLQEINEVLLLPGFEHLIIQNHFSSSFGRKAAYFRALAHFQHNDIDPLLFLLEIAAPALERDIITEDEAKGFMSFSKDIPTGEYHPEYHWEAITHLKEAGIFIPEEEKVCRFPKMAALLYEKRKNEDILNLIGPGASPELLDKIWNDCPTDPYSRKIKLAKEMLKHNCSADTAGRIYHYLVVTHQTQYPFRFTLDYEFMRTAKLYAIARGVDKPTIRKIEKNIKAATLLR